MSPIILAYVLFIRFKDATVTDTPAIPPLPVTPIRRIVDLSPVAAVLPGSDSATLLLIAEVLSEPPPRLKLSSAFSTSSAPETAVTLTFPPAEIVTLSSTTACTLE